MDLLVGIFFDDAEGIVIGVMRIRGTSTRWVVLRCSVKSRRLLRFTPRALLAPVIPNVQIKMCMGEIDTPMEVPRL